MWLVRGKLEPQEDKTPFVWGVGANALIQFFQKHIQSLLFGHLFGIDQMICYRIFFQCSTIWMLFVEVARLQIIDVMKMP